MILLVYFIGEKILRFVECSVDTCNMFKFNIPLCCKIIRKIIVLYFGDVCCLTIITTHINNNNNNNNNNGGKVTILWNQQVQTDRTIPNKKPDTLIRDNEKGTCMLIDVEISGDRNVIKKEAEKILKYKDLTIEIQRMWNAKTKVLPVIIGALGLFQSHSENT